MSGGISVHVVDVTRGLPAESMQVEIFQLGVPEPIAAGCLSGKGTLDHPIVQKQVKPGVYEVVFTWATSTVNSAIRCPIFRLWT